MMGEEVMILRRDNRLDEEGRDLGVGQVLPVGVLEDDPHLVDTVLVEDRRLHRQQLLDSLRPDVVGWIEGDEPVGQGTQTQAGQAQQDAYPDQDFFYHCVERLSADAKCCRGLSFGLDGLGKQKNCSDKEARQSSTTYGAYRP